jgi:hypothetical protein
MSRYRAKLLRAYELEPTIDWRALFVLSTLVSGAAAICAVMLMHF